jgi:Fe-S cluster biogenesis protein NfuA
MTHPDCGSSSKTRSQLRSRIEEVLDQSVRPELREDGGDVELVGIDDDCIVQIRLSGACQGCSSAAITLAMQIEATVKAQVPEVRFLEPVP